jgi:hypothetical protein
MTSRLNNPNQALTQKNVNTHIFTEFSEMNKETTQQQVLDAIKNININVGEIVLGDITVESSDTVTHDKLTTLNTTVTNKHLNSSTDSISVSGTVAISNDIIVVDNINNTDAPYDLIINGPTLWADSTPLVNPFFADPNGREGWYYDNFSNIANKSNIYWYANPVSGNLQENDMTFAQLSGMYCIITSDYVENGALTNPIMNVYSQPTGTNDFIPTFAHSMWAYSLTNINVAKLRKAETIMLYTGTTRPQVHLNIPAYPLVLAGTNGDALSSEIVAYMTVNTQATTSKIGYLLQYTGFLNSAIGFNREFQFKNGKERVIQNNQYSGSINVGNFPTTQAISGSVSVSNFPTTQAISGSVNATVSNFPSTQAISGSVSVSNFPATQPISGSVSVSNTSLAVTGDFYPATQPISGSVSVSNLPATQPISGSVSVSNFPATQPISGSVSVSNTSLAVTGDFYPTTQPISGNVGITGTPSVTIGNASIDTHCYASNNGTNWHHLKSDANGILNVHSRTEDGAGNDITSTEIGAVRALDVNLAGGSITVDSVKIKDSSGNSLAAVSNLVPQLKTTLYNTSATEIGTALNPIFSSITNSPTVKFSNSGGDNNVKLRDTNGTPIYSIGIGGIIQGSLKSVLIGPSDAYIGDTPATPHGTVKLGINSFIINDSNTPILTGGYNGTSAKVFKVNSNDSQFVAIDTSNNTIKIDSSNNTIKIDSSNNTIKLSDGTFTANVLPTIANLRDAEALVTDSALFAFNTTTGDVQPLTVNLNGNKNQLEVRDDEAIVELTSIDSKLTSVSNRLQTQSTLVDAEGDVATISTPTTTTTPSTIRGLDTQSYLNAYNFLTDLYGNLTSTLSSPATPSSSYNALDVYARNPNTQVVNYGQTTVNGVSGLNIYQVYPKKIHYTLAGRSESTSAAVIMGGTGSQAFIYGFTFGKATPQPFSAIMAIGSAVPRTIKYHYINSLGDLKTDGSITINNTNTVVNLTPSNIISVNKHWIDGVVGTTEQVLIRVGTVNAAGSTIASADFDDYYNGVITVPNGYIGYLTQFSPFTPTAMYIYVYKWDETSIRTMVYNHYNGGNVPVCSGSNGSIGGIFTAGESIAFGKSGGGASVVCGNFVLEPI